MKFKDTLDYEMRMREFRLLFITCMVVFIGVFIISIVAFYDFFSIDFEIGLKSVLGLNFCSFFALGFHFFYSIYLLISLMIDKKHFNEAYIFETHIDEYCNHWGLSSKYRIKFKYKDEDKSLMTFWFYDDFELENTIVEVGYIESLDKIIIMRKIS